MVSVKQVIQLLKSRNQEYASNLINQICLHNEIVNKAGTARVSLVCDSIHSKKKWYGRSWSAALSMQ